MNDFIKKYDKFYHIKKLKYLEDAKQKGLEPRLGSQYLKLQDKPFTCFFPANFLLHSMEMFIAHTEEEYILFEINANFFYDKNINWDNTHDFYQRIDKWNELSNAEKISKSIEEAGSFICYDAVPWNELRYLNLSFKKSPLRKIT